MKITVRNGVIGDVPAILALIKELATYERAPNEVTATVESMKKDGFGNRPVFESIVAEEKGKIVGIAVFYVCYSTWKGKIVYLDDLLVTEAKRGKGIGKILLDAVAKFSKEVGANQLRWHVLDWNTPAIEFYKKYDAAFDETWITCKLTKEQLQKF